MKTIMKKSLALLVVFTMILGVAGTFQAPVQAAESTDYTIKVNLGTNCTTIYKNGKAIKAMICSPSSETPTGTFYVPVKYLWHDMIGNCYAQYCTRITTGILFHSVWYYKKYDKSTMSVSAYNVMVQKASHGCVRLLCKDAKWIYDHCAVGTKIQIFWGYSGDDPIKRPGFTPITNGKHTDWDPTDPDPKNPYKKSKPEILVKETTIEYGSEVDLKDLITVKDSAGNTLSTSEAKIKTSGKVNTKKIGSYKVTYTVTDSLGSKQTKTVKFKVVDTQSPILEGAKDQKNIAMGSDKNVLTGVKAKAVSGKNLTSKIKVSVKYKNKKVKVSKGVVTFTKKGTYKITYKVTGSNKKVTTKTVKYKVTDQRVQFALKKKTVKIKQGSKFNAYSYVDYVKTYKGKALNIKKNVTYTGEVDTSKAGNYTITYTANHKGLKYTERTRTLKVVVQAEEETTTGPEETSSAQDETTSVEESSGAEEETTPAQEETTFAQEETTSAQ